MDRPQTGRRDQECRRGWGGDGYPLQPDRAGEGIRARPRDYVRESRVLVLARAPEPASTNVEHGQAREGSGHANSSGRREFGSSGNGQAVRREALAGRAARCGSYSSVVCGSQGKPAGPCRYDMAPSVTLVGSARYPGRQQAGILSRATGVGPSLHLRRPWRLASAPRRRRARGGMRALALVVQRGPGRQRRFALGACRVVHAPLPAAKQDDAKRAIDRRWVEAEGGEATADERPTPWAMPNRGGRRCAVGPQTRPSAPFTLIDMASASCCMRCYGKNRRLVR